MAFNKIINGNRSTRGSMRNCIEYALKDEKVKEGLVHVTGPFNYDCINWKTCYSSFIDEKNLWNKNSGRMYMHSVLSFHKDEDITPYEAFEFAKDLAENDPFYKDFQTIVAIHQDRDHIHCHFVSNSVSFIDGHKEHHSIKDFKGLMERTNEKAKSLGLTVTKKGHHFNGEPIEEYEVSSMDNRKYQAMKNHPTKSFVFNCMVAVEDAKSKACSKDEFIELMNQKGWKVTWNHRKHITFENEENQKVRDSNLSKTFNTNINKEELENELSRNKEKSTEYDFREYYKQLELIDTDSRRHAETINTDSQSLKRPTPSSVSSNKCSDRDKSKANGGNKQSKRSERKVDDRVGASQNSRRTTKAHRRRR